MGENQRVPRLFASGGTPIAEGNGVSHGVQTPMGEVRFTASDGGRQIATGQPERWRVGDNAWLERWESSGLELERVTCKIAPELPPGKRVDGCWGVIWRLPRRPRDRSSYGRCAVGGARAARVWRHRPVSCRPRVRDRHVADAHRHAGRGCARRSSGRRDAPGSMVARPIGGLRRADVCHRRRCRGGSPPVRVGAAVV
jgi:hypothetical protein